MSIYFLSPSFTEEITNKIFRQLCNSEIKKQLDFMPECQDSFQTGYMECLVDLFGAANDDDVIKTLEEEKSWLNVLNEIMESDSVRKFLSDNTSISDENIWLIDDVSTEAVTKYLESKLDKAITALKSL